jgi:hypothetical protein
MIKFFLGLALGSLIGGGTVFAAATDTPVIDQRIENQARRIDQGVNSGALTEREGARMDGRLDRIEQAQDRAQADGKFTSNERRRLNRALNHNSKKIYKEKHDRQLRESGRADSRLRRARASGSFLFLGRLLPPPRQVIEAPPVVLIEMFRIIEKGRLHAAGENRLAALTIHRLSRHFVEPAIKRRNQ